MAAEEPAYTLVERDGPIEIRDYAPQIIAEVVVEGDRRQASGRGFRPLAGISLAITSRAKRSP
jgi:hypothetical protein